MASTEEAKLERFLEWLQVNGVELRGCSISYSNSTKGFGIFSSNETSDGVLLVVPLDLAITPMRVLQEPLLGPECRAMFEEGEVDDRFLMILFLTVERLRKNSKWKLYLDMLPTCFRNPLWFTEDEMSELKGTTLYRATELQKKKLLSLYNDKVEGLVKKLLSLDGDSESKVCFEDFLWANSVFWSRALNIPLPYSYVFPQNQQVPEECSSFDKNADTSASHESTTESVTCHDGKGCEAEEHPSQVPEANFVSTGETVWVEGLVPGIDFCNHDLKPIATWEVDGAGSVSGVPFSMYLLSVEQSSIQMEKEISISYGNKGNEELLYLYGFVMENNKDDYLMVHYPMEAIRSIPFSDSKMQLLEAQKAEIRCLLPKSLLNHGFFPADASKDKDNDKNKMNKFSNFSWSGHRKAPSYLNKLVFPDDFLTALRTIAMQEDELFKVSALLEELVESRPEKQPSEAEVRAAVWEACGDSGALQLLVDLLNAKMMELEENSGTEGQDAELLEKSCFADNPQKQITERDANGLNEQASMSRNKWSCIVYRRGQKELTRSFLKEAEHALQLSLSESN